MQHLTILEQNTEAIERARPALRIAVCRHCPARPAGSETLGADAPRECESHCDLFNQLSRLVRLGRQIDPIVGSFDRIMHGHLRELSQQSIIDKGKPGRASHRARPWALHTHRIIRILHNLVGH